ncbi:MAG: hypothetical protein ACPGSG_08965 [Prolixibacteraceae bacterium]
MIPSINAKNAKEKAQKRKNYANQRKRILKIKYQTLNLTTKRTTYYYNVFPLTFFYIQQEQ